jgi:hypothetical protein
MYLLEWFDLKSPWWLLKLIFFKKWKKNGKIMVAQTNIYNIKV